MAKKVIAERASSLPSQERMGKTAADISNSEEGSEFGQFLLTEYNNVAAAHFKTIDAISDFLKHYLTIISAPIAILGVLVGIKGLSNTDSLMSSSLVFAVALLFVVIALIGFFMLWYAINLRMDAILYARTVNGIRAYFYDRENQLDIATKSKIRSLPRSPFLPPYREFRFFGPTLLIFALLDSVYFLVGLLASSAVIAGQTPCCNSATALIAAIGGLGPLLAIPTIASLLFFVSHLVLYIWLGRRRDRVYLRSNILGVDVDGVLNRHRDQFCSLLTAKTGRTIRPEQITSIPVHDCSELGVSRADERQVFNDPAYWIAMPVLEGAADVLSRLRNAMNLEIHIFTHRPWPLVAGMTRKERKATLAQWKGASSQYVRSVRRKISWDRRLRLRFGSTVRIWPYRWRRLQMLIRKGNSMDRVTQAWLEQNGFRYDAILIEKGGEEVSDPSSCVVNRFYASRDQAIRFFVEDDLTTARKLAFICDVVFLLDHPYNQTETLPANVIRVYSWDDIYRHVKELW